MGLNEAESDYFILLVQIQRAGTQSLKRKFERDLQKIKTKSQDIATRVAVDARLSDSDAAQFYSSWLYAAVRQLSSIPEFQNRSRLLEKYNIKKDELNRVVDFLISTNLCIEKSGKVLIGPNKTHLDSKSPLVYLHHKNWRLKGIEKHNNLNENELMYSAPFTVSANDFLLFREKIVQLIQELVEITDSSKPETLACFNADLFFIE